MEKESSEKLKIEEKKLKNDILRADLIEHYLENFGKLTGIIVLACSLLAQLGIITFRSMQPETKALLDVAESVSGGGATVSIPQSVEFKYAQPNALTKPFQHKRTLLDMIKIENYALLIVTIASLWIIFRKKKKAKEEANASTDSIDNKS